MWRLKREPIPGTAGATHVSVELADTPAPVAVSAEALAAAADGPLPLTDAAIIATLRQQIAIRDKTIERLHAQLAEAAADPEQPRHPLAGRRFDDATDDPDQLISRLRAQLQGQIEHAGELSRQLDDALARLADHDAADRDGTCPGCLGHQRTIADYEKAARADGRRIRELERALRAAGGAVAHAEAHRELAAEAAP